MAQTKKLTQTIMAGMLSEFVTNRGSIAANTDWNTITKSGYYTVSGKGAEAQNFPPASTNYGILIVFNVGANRLVQIYIPDGNYYMYIRMKVTNWQSWKKLTMESVSA